MKNIPAVILAALIFGFLSNSVEAVPIEYRISGTVASGRALIAPSVLINLANVLYTIVISTDTDSPDLDPPTDEGLFWGFGLTVRRIEFETVGSFPFTSPDAIRKSDDGATAGFITFWAGGMEGLISLAAPTGTMGSPNQLMPFAPVNVTSGSVDVGGWNWDGLNQVPSMGVWFVSNISSEHPIQISADVPDSGATALLLGLGLLGMGLAACRCSGLAPKNPIFQGYLLTPTTEQWGPLAPVGAPDSSSKLSFLTVAIVGLAALRRRFLK